MVAGIPPVPKPFQNAPDTAPAASPCKVAVEKALEAIPTLKKQIAKLTESVLTQEAIVLNLQQQTTGGNQLSDALDKARQKLGKSREELSDQA